MNNSKSIEIFLDKEAAQCENLIDPAQHDNQALDHRQSYDPLVFVQA